MEKRTWELVGVVSLRSLVVEDHCGQVDALNLMLAAGTEAGVGMEQDMFLNASYKKVRGHLFSFFF